MQSARRNFAFIDSQNLNLAIRAQGWFLSFRKFRVYLAEKYSVERAYIFIGYLEGNNRLYLALQEAGFMCIFKPTLTYKDGTTKGNCDAELVLQAMIDFAEYDRAIIVSGDGDFYCLVKYLIEQKKLLAMMIPDKRKYSALLKMRVIRSHLRFMNDLREKLSHKKEKTPQGRNLEG